jgi:hypothetical protein
MVIAGQRLDKYVSSETETHAVREELFQAVLSMRSLSSLYSKGQGPLLGVAIVS